MSVEIIHNKNYLPNIRVHLVNEIFDLLSPVHCGAMLSDTYMVASAKWLYESKYTAGSIANIFGVNFFIVSRTHCPGVTYFTEKLIWLFIHTDNRAKGIIGQLVSIKDLLHSSNEFRIRYVWDTPVFTSVRSKPVFFRARRMASRLIGSSRIIFISSSRSRIVHLL